MFCYSWFGGTRLICLFTWVVVGWVNVSWLLYLLWLFATSLVCCFVGVGYFSFVLLIFASDFGLSGFC